MAVSAGATALMLICTVALVLASLTGMRSTSLILAFAPGGLAEMSLIAISLGVETAFVATHHVARIAMIVIGAPIVFRAKRRLRAARGRNLPTKSNSSDEQV